jgi:hypothetical protein
MSKFPKGNKGLKRKLRSEQQSTNLEVRRALLEASAALDAQTGELIALRRVVISERAQVIYYSDKYLAFLAHECVDVKAVNFLDLDESVQEPYVKRAIEELSEARGVVPHDRESVAKKVVFP